MNILIRTDSSLKIGNGHVVRSITLAIELRDKGHTIIFVTEDLDGNVNHLITDNSFDLIIINCETRKDFEVTASREGQLEDALKCKLATDQKVEFIIVDHYSLDHIWETAISQHFKARVLVIDDMATRTHNCNFLLNQNFSLAKNRYAHRVNSKCVILEGPTYCLLRKEFQKFKPKKVTCIRRLLIMYGGSDPYNLTLKTLRHLMHIITKNVDVIIGPNNNNFHSINSLIGKNNLNYNLYKSPKNVADIMQNCDLAIGSGGSTTWERLYFNIPSIVIIEGRNQRQLCHDLEVHNFLKSFENIPSSLPKIMSTVKSLINGNITLSQFYKSNTIVDGHGAQRVVRAITL